MNRAVYDGRLTLDEHEARTQAALQAVYISELQALTTDLIAPVVNATPKTPSWLGSLWLSGR
jgi:hypothetical protein